MNKEQIDDGYPDEILKLADEAFLNRDFLSKNGSGQRGFYDCGFLHGYRVCFERAEKLVEALNDLIDDHVEGCDCWHHLALKAWREGK